MIKINFRYKINNFSLMLLPIILNNNSYMEIILKIKLSIVKMHKNYNSRSNNFLN